MMTRVFSTDVESPARESTSVTLPLRSRWMRTVAVGSLPYGDQRGRKLSDSSHVLTSVGSPGGRWYRPCLMCGRHTTAGAVAAVGWGEKITTVRKPAGSRRRGRRRTRLSRITSTRRAALESRSVCQTPMGPGFPPLP